MPILLSRPAAAAVFALAAAGAALAQPSAPPDAAIADKPPEAAPAPPSTDCGGKAGRYAAGKLTLWVVRRGTLEREDPLRPLAPEPQLLLQVVVNGRDATAFGPDARTLQQGPAARELERDARLAWSGADGLPRTLRIVASDGRALFDGLSFQECGDAPRPKTAATGPKPPPLPRRGAAARGDPDAPSVVSRPLPQGALPGLSLAKP